LRIDSQCGGSETVARDPKLEIPIGSWQLPGSVQEQLAEQKQEVVGSYGFTYPRDAGQVRLLNLKPYRHERRVGGINVSYRRGETLFQNSAV
jgi:hypothetical protein